MNLDEPSMKFQCIALQFCLCKPILYIRIFKKENRLSCIIDELDNFEEVHPLAAQEVELKSQSNAQIARLLREEKLKWYQRSKSQFILEGGSNTRYTSIMWPTAGIGRNLYTPPNRARARSKVMRS